jgi:hypothetical protein
VKIAVIWMTIAAVMMSADLRDRRLKGVMELQAVMQLQAVMEPRRVMELKELMWKRCRVSYLDRLTNHSCAPIRGV